MSPQQIPLSFPVEESYDPHDFIPLSCNDMAMEWVNRFPNWPYPAVIIYGEKGCGKTHLLGVWADKIGEAGHQNGQVIDNAHQYFCDLDAEKELFHLFNQSKENGGFLLLSIDKKTSLDTIQLPDLKSRLMAAPLIEIEQPNEDDLAVILMKLGNDRQLKLSADVVKYILPRIERSFIAARDLIEKMDQLSMAEKRSITIPLVKRIL